MLSHTNQNDKLLVFAHTNFISLSAHVLILFLYMALRDKHPGIFHHIINIFSMAVHVLCNLFREIYPLFEAYLCLLICSKYAV